MPEPLRCIPSSTIIAGIDFSTGGVKALAFTVTGKVVAEVRLPTDLWTADGVSELNLMQLEGQARTVTRLLASKLRMLGRLDDWRIIGISATHHTAGRTDADGNQVRRAICWNDQTLAPYHSSGLNRLGGQERARELTGGPWAVRYSLSHLVKDELMLPKLDWDRTRWILPHGPLAAGYLTGRFDCTSVSSAASTGIMDLRTNQWCRDMLDALDQPSYRELAWNNLPKIIDMNEPVGTMAEHVALDARLPAGIRPVVYPTLDDQAAGLIGGGAVDAGQVAVILGNSAVVNSSSNELPRSSNLDAMKLNWGPYLWMRCYSNGAQFIDQVAGRNWHQCKEADAVPPGSNGTIVLPFLLSEPSVGVNRAQVTWFPSEPMDYPTRVRACLEAIGYLITLGIREHQAAGQNISQITVSGGMAQSQLMCEILASILNRPLVRLEVSEGPALGAAVVALAGAETRSRCQQGINQPFTAADAANLMVSFGPTIRPRPDWLEDYRQGLTEFTRHLPNKQSL
jgi:sugar (pentulose or hexulose) kinase